MQNTGGEGLAECLPRHRKGEIVTTGGATVP